MSPLDTVAPSRRTFLTGAGALMIGLTLPMKTRAQDAALSATHAYNAFVRVGADNLVTVIVKHIEFGQGPWTGLATLVADEMDADWVQIRAEHAPADNDLYTNKVSGGMQITGGSTAMADSFLLMRKAGAAARAMLVSAAAEAWGVEAADIRVEKGIIAHPSSGQSATFGTFAERAAGFDVPQEPTLKTPDQFVYIGKNVPKLDTASKSNGDAIFTLDVYKDDMLTVVLEHPSVFGAKVGSVDDAKARVVSGVADVKQLSTGVAVYGENTFAALKGRKLLDVSWDTSEAETRTSDEIMAERVAAVKRRGAVAGETGDVDQALASAATTLEADYEFPYLVHAPMEPLDAVIARRDDGGIDVWMGSQAPGFDQQAVAAVTGVEQAQVHVHTMLAGGSFGRRAQPMSQFAAEAAEVFMAAGGEQPVKLMWTREDDIQGGFYRPVTAHRMRGGLDADGNIVAWDHVMAGQSFLYNTPFESMMIQNGVDAGLVEGGSAIPYAVPNFNASCHILNCPVTTLWWRSVGHTHTGYTVETFIDELLEKGGRDVVEGRLALMGDHQRLAATLRRVAEMADWGRSLPEGHALGVASVESFRSYVSEIAEVSIEDGVPRVHKVWCAVDCGIAVNPEIIKAQMEGGIGYGLGAVLFNELELGEGGKVMQSNFHDYRSLRIAEMPDVETSIITSDAAPTGVGEPGTPPIGPAVANAVRQLTGQPVRKLPMIKSLKA
ncbi:xanthine dehydrogenase family protein molybdopterin-binding subunit [Parvularcula sp. IMCC14364]|uniref:xanthine dehydrogenase family protein molybdopterin-binding subunit n=1 Tax=Parvularcula sp. IMCC14364 TaxID=3067902 RepID=UPI002741AB4F|nr:xanthine dehydrogenase family protein molybdopterin-binding subunit [Parvularcula sp. IMCC14364]